MFQDIHHTPGRLRIRVREIYRDAREARALRRELRRVPGVELVRCSPLTASLVVYYDDRVTGPERLIRAVITAGYLDSRQVARALAPVGFPAFERAVERITAWAIRKLLERSASALLGSLG